jgi:hypothetical protein
VLQLDEENYHQLLDKINSILKKEKLFVFSKSQ